MAGSQLVPFPTVDRLTPVRAVPPLRADRAMVGSGSSSPGAGQCAAIKLINNSPGSNLIVVRGISWGPIANGPLQIGYSTLANGAAVTVGVQPLLPDRAKLVGLLTTRNASTPLSTPQWVDFTGEVPSGMVGAAPLFALPPGWAIDCATQTAAVPGTVSILWEVLTPEEFVESYGAFF